MSNRPAPAPFTLSDAVDRFVHTVGISLLTLAVLALIVKSGADASVAWDLVAHMMRTVWVAIVDAVTF